MDDQPGATTPQEAPSAGQPHPGETEECETSLADQERTIRRYGLRCAIAGGAFIFAALVAAAVVAATNPDLIDWPDGVLIVSIAAFAFLMTVGGLLLGVAGTEPLNRHARALTRRMIDIQTELLGQHADMGWAIDRIAEHLPEDQQIRNWRGFNDAVKKGFLQQTGTEGADAANQRQGRPGHLNVVRRGNGDRR